MPVGAREPSEVKTPEIPRRRATSKIADAYSRVNPVLVWDASPRVLVVSTLTDEELCSSECERRNFVEASASIFFHHENTVVLTCHISLTTSSVCRCDFRFSLTGDIPLSPGDIPRS